MIVKKIELEKGIINIHDDFIPKNEVQKEKRLRSIYDVFNQIHKSCILKKINIDDWFYSETELEKNKILEELI